MLKQRGASQYGRRIQSSCSTFSAARILDEVAKTEGEVETMASVSLQHILHLVPEVALGGHILLLARAEAGRP